MTVPDDHDWPAHVAHLVALLDRTEASYARYRHLAEAIIQRQVEEITRRSSSTGREPK
jgi:hypothetical protein